VRKNKRKTKQTGAAPESCFDCSSYAQDKAGADLLKFMLVSLPRNRPPPTLILSTMGTLGLCDVGPSSNSPLPGEISSGKEEEQLAQARLEMEALKRDLAESRAREVDANTRGDSKLAQARAEIEALRQNLVGARTTEVDANARGDREGLISPVRAHRELAELRNAHTRAAAQQIHTPLETRSEGSPDLFVPPSEREGFLPTRLREASQYETEAAWRETRAALQRETEAAWRETQTALREKEVKEAEARIEREAARKEIAAVRMERDKEVAASRAERDAALTRNLEEVSVLRAERDAALKEAAGKETALAVAQAVRDTESRMTAELTRQDQHLMAQWHLGPTQYEHNGAGLPSVTSCAEMGSRNTGRDRFGDATTDADLRESVSSLVGPPRDDSDAARARITPPPVSQQRPSRPASANNADTRLRGSPYQQQQQRPQQRVQNQNRRRG